MIREVAIVQEQPGVRLVLILQQVVDASGVEARRSPDDAVDGLALIQQ